MTELKIAAYRAAVLAKARYNASKIEKLNRLYQVTGILDYKHRAEAVTQNQARLAEEFNRKNALFVRLGF